MTRVLVVGGREGGSCRTTCQLEPRGYTLTRLPSLPLPAFLPPADIAILVRLDAPADAVISACVRLREAGAASLVLLADADPDTVARLLEAGADDCLPAPHNPHEVLARVRALLRRREKCRSAIPRPQVFADGCRLDPLAAVIHAPDGRRVGITPLQNRLLGALLERPGEVVSRERLLAHVLGEDTDSFDRAIDVHVSRLKKRLALVGGAELITSYRGVGYRLGVDSAAP